MKRRLPRAARARGRAACARPPVHSRHATADAWRRSPCPACSPALASADDLGQAFDYARHEEGQRRCSAITRNLHRSAPTPCAPTAVSPAPGWHAALDFNQDTWSGATPVTTLPLAAMSPLSDAQLLAGASARPATGQIAAALVDAAMHPYVNNSDNVFQPRYGRDDARHPHDDRGLAGNA